MRELLVALLLVLVFGGAIIGCAVWFRGKVSYFNNKAQRLAEAKASPYKQIDYDMMVGAGMTPEQIEKAIVNASELRSRRGLL